MLDKKVSIRDVTLSGVEVFVVSFSTFKFRIPKQNISFKNIHKKLINFHNKMLNLTFLRKI